MSIIDSLFNPLRKAMTYVGSANAPTFYDYKDGYISGPSEGRPLYPGEQQAIDEYNAKVGNFNRNQRDTLNDFLNQLLPLSRPGTVISPTVGTSPDPLVKTIVYVDPLVLDLDGDGLEITPLSQGVLFDANGDALKTGTAWVGGDDGLLVWDRNGNGTIDTGVELFGDETLLANGEKATHGFAALSELDTGSLVDGITVGAGDGVFDAQDAQYNTLRIWRDLNQDGVSQANELQTLAQSGVRGISLASRTDNTNYGDAILAQSGSFTRTDGSTGQAGSFILAQNNFVREFVPITVSDAAKALLDLKGSGWVRDFRQAGSVREFA